MHCLIKLLFVFAISSLSAVVLAERAGYQHHVDEHRDNRANFYSDYQQGFQSPRRVEHHKLAKRQHKSAKIRHQLAKIEQSHAIASNAEKTVILFIHQLEKIYKKRGETVQFIALLKELLDNTQNMAIRNVAYHKLSQSYRHSGNASQAIAVLKQAIAENLTQVNK